MLPFNIRLPSTASYEEFDPMVSFVGESEHISNGG